MVVSAASPRMVNVIGTTTVLMTAAGIVMVIVAA